MWDTDRGLPDYAAKSFAQTPDGFLWIATFEGLVRFDGARPGEIVGAALYLAGPLASYTTGALLSVDGGRLAAP